MEVYDNKTISALEHLRNKSLNKGQQSGERPNYDTRNTYQSQPTEMEEPINNTKEQVVNDKLSSREKVEQSNRYMETLGYVSEEVQPFIVPNPNIDNNVSVVEKPAMPTDLSTNALDIFPSIRSIINKTSVSKVKPNVTLEVLCDNYTIELVADSTELAVAEFRRACSVQGIEGLEQLTKSMSVSYKEKVTIFSDRLKRDVDSDYEISNFSNFEGEGVSVGSAIQTIFDRVGIGYLLD